VARHSASGVACHQTCGTSVTLPGRGGVRSGLLLFADSPRSSLAWAARILAVRCVDRLATVSKGQRKLSKDQRKLIISPRKLALSSTNPVTIDELIEDLQQGKLTHRLLPKLNTRVRFPSSAPHTLPSQLPQQIGQLEGRRQQHALDL
jgi:hypothetical protein